MAAYLTYEALIRSMEIPRAPQPMRITDDIKDMTQWPTTVPDGWSEWYAHADEVAA